MPRSAISVSSHYNLVDFSKTAEFISNIQKNDGEIPWFEGGKTDPWDHVESAMGLTVGGRFKEARKAYFWSAGKQLEDGSWWSQYHSGEPQKGAYKDPNMSAYISVGVLHYHMVTGDYEFLRNMWRTVSTAMDFVIQLQGDGGEVFWAKRADGSIDRKALLTGSSSIYKSLTCALKIASLLNIEKPRWEIARMKLKKAIKYKPHHFDRSKYRYSMDWYYPILCGALKGKEAGNRIERFWDVFVVPVCGVRCVSDKPWVTVAETSELVQSLAAMGNYEDAERVFGWILDKRYNDGSFWTGVTLPYYEIYTKEKTTWTAGAVLLAADMLYNLTPASELFSHNFEIPTAFSSKSSEINRELNNNRV